MVIFNNGWCPFATTHPTKLIINNVKYRSINQYLQANKAKMFGDLTAYKMIMNSTSAKLQTEIGSMVNGFTSSSWEPRMEKLLILASMYRFEQDQEARGALLETGDAIIVFATPHDRLLGTGMALDDAQITSIESWPGRNLLGYTLMQVRNDLKQRGNVSASS